MGRVDARLHPGAHGVSSVFMFVFAVVAIAFAPVGHAWAKDPSVAPAAVNLHLAKGATSSFTVAVDPGGSVADLDVVFVFDTTSSMNGVLEAAKKQGASLASDILRQAPGARFAVASFSDYPGTFSYSGYSASYGESGDYPWRVDLAMTAGADEVQSAMRSLSLHDGQDPPEDYARVLDECAKSKDIGWRNQSKRIVVIFGDAPPHDLSFDGSNTGGDPGPDGVAGTADDVDFEHAVSGLARNQTAVLAVDCGTNSPARTAFKYMAIQTKGQYATLTDPSDLRAKVLAVVRRETRTIDRLVLQPQGRQASWVKVTPAVISMASPSKVASFRVTVNVPKDAGSVGTGDVQLAGFADGAGLGITQVNVLVRDPKPTGFLPSQDGWGFGNASSQADENQFLAYYGGSQVVSSDGHWYFAARECFANDWAKVGTGGSCFGMSSSAVAFQKKLQAISTVPSGRRLSQARKPTTRAFGSWFNHGLESSWIEDYQARLTDARFQATVAQWLNQTPNKVCSGILDSLDNGQPAIVYVSSFDPKSVTKTDDGWDAHALVAYNYVVNGDQTLINVYDCNHPGDDNRAVIFDTSKDSWRYDLGFGIGWWSYGKGGMRYSETLRLFSSWKKMSREALKGMAGSCLVGFNPVQNVLGPGTPPWNPTKAAQEGVTSDGTVAGSEFVSVSGGSARSALDGSSTLTWTGPVGFNPETSSTPTGYATYVGRQGNPLSIAIEATASGPGIASVYSAGEFVSLTTSDAVSIAATVSPDGAVSVAATSTSPTRYSYASSRETSRSSHAFEIAGATVEGGGVDAITPSADFRTLEFVNGGQSATYTVVVHSIGTQTREYGASGIKIDRGDRHITSVSSWDRFDSSPPLVLVDRGNDGTIDETITLRPINGPTSGGGAGGAGLVLGLGTIGLLGGVFLLRRPTGKPVSPEVYNDSWSWADGCDADESVSPSLPSAVLGAITIGGVARTLDSSRVYLIGRDAGSDMHLADPKVSAHHARLVPHLENGRTSWWLEDLASANGVYVNGQRVTGETRLHDGDAIRMGDTQITFL
jgi:hypothetical protein